MIYPKIITKEYLRSHPNVIFVFGDNLQRYGKGGAAKLRDEPNTYGFITKKEPTNHDDSFYTCEEYERIFEGELEKLQCQIERYPEKIFLISAIGRGLANRFYIFERIINPRIKIKLHYHNVVFLW